MHPAFSVIFFTTMAGAGQGLVVVLAVAGAEDELGVVQLYGRRVGNRGIIVEASGHSRHDHQGKPHQDRARHRSGGLAVGSTGWRMELSPPVR